MKQILLFAFLSCGFLTGTAQQLRTAYFMDKATLRTSMNPALRPARGFISIPAAGSISESYVRLAKRRGAWLTCFTRRTAGW